MDPVGSVGFGKSELRKPKQTKRERDMKFAPWFVL